MDDSLKPNPEEPTMPSEAPETSQPVVEPTVSPDPSVSSYQPEAVVSPNPSVSVQPVVSSPTVEPTPVAPVGGMSPVNSVPTVGNMGGSTTPVSPKQNSKNLKTILPIAIVLVILVIVGCVMALVLSKSTTPTSAFNDALSNALSTKNLEQTASAAGSSIDIKYNVANIESPVISSAASLDLFGENAALTGYGTFSNSYIKYKTITSTEGSTASLDDILNKWVQVKTDGKVAANADASLEQLIDPTYNFFGQYIFGNFSASQRSTLTSYIESNDIYKFNAKNVTKTTLNGASVYKYQVTLNTTKLTDLNNKVAAMINLPKNDYQDITSVLSDGPSSATMYVDTSSKELVKVTATTQGVTETINYKNFNDTTLPSAPQPQLTFAEYLGLLAAPTTSGSTSD
jgi:hypothetical protein